MKITLLIITFLAFVAVGSVVSWPRTFTRDGVLPTPTPQLTEIDTVKEYLLTSAAQDFHDHQPPRPVGFRNVRLFHLMKGEDVSYRLCGEFLPAQENGKAEWTPFVTIKTSGYEQYIGSNTSYCSDRKLVRDTKTDLSSVLKSKFDSIR